MKRVSIITLNWNGKELLVERLQSVHEAVNSVGSRHEIVVVNNASSEEGVRFVKTNYQSARL